ncbi:MAG: hypothetical protein PHQ40_06125 [Anaerolineaceae bacterium]|nr:hypothetical protein [Anaerolineaceae bacterium]
MGDEVTNLVECHSGYEYAERPIAVRWEGQRLTVEQIEAEWRIPGGRCFRVRTSQGQRFELFYGELYDEWRINPV